jgi:hypothetical protein
MAKQRFGDKKVVRRDMLGAFLRHGMDAGEAERGGLLQLFVIPSIPYRRYFKHLPVSLDPILLRPPSVPQSSGYALTLSSLTVYVQSSKQPAFLKIAPQAK